MVDDVAEAGPRVLALGAVRLDVDVYADPAGHPFCLIPRPGWAMPISDTGPVSDTVPVSDTGPIGASGE
jgi:hypothetical protein